MAEATSTSLSFHHLTLGGISPFSTSTATFQKQRPENATTDTVQCVRVKYTRHLCFTTHTSCIFTKRTPLVSANFLLMLLLWFLFVYGLLGEGQGNETGSYYIALVILELAKETRLASTSK